MVHIGDSVSKDLLGALKCGMRALLLTRPEGQLERSDKEEEVSPSVFLFSPLKECRTR